ncbi:Coenzyme F420 hydrogenase/dehydrogenase, beta subunit C-terminal domain [Marispirochaeta aestuarii]|nr:Coenzyme F420 hydrogenase/dehydrogenase, beta subunit C-terminal domain [Marispirochaeta aestuarii]
MIDYPEEGLRPALLRDLTPEENKKSLKVCPGICVPAQVNKISVDPLVGPVVKAWIGHAANQDVRRIGSSGGIITAISTYCLENDLIDYVAHTGMDAAEPWKNCNVISQSSVEILQKAGSRYAPSSPCEHFSVIRENKKKYVFVGKPCDVAALALTIKQQPELLECIPLVLSFFCAGVPATKSAFDLVNDFMDGRMENLQEVHYRGNGWPGEFRIKTKDLQNYNLYSYAESWHILQASRGLRCRLCADGMGDLADIACGDAWHLYKHDGNLGLSIVVARTKKGCSIVEDAIKDGYLVLREIKKDEILRSQGTDSGIINRRCAIWGRLFVLKLLGIPVTRFKGVPLRKAWKQLDLRTRLRIIIGTVVRVIKYGWNKPSH